MRSSQGSGESLRSATTAIRVRASLAAALPPGAGARGPASWLR
jgi:hypothetical protein